MEVRETIQNLKNKGCEDELIKSLCRKENGEIMTIDEIADKIGVHKDHVYKLLSTIKPLCEAFRIKVIDEDVTDKAIYHMKRMLDVIEGQGDYLRVKR